MQTNSKVGSFGTIKPSLHKKSEASDLKFQGRVGRKISRWGGGTTEKNKTEKLYHLASICFISIMFENPVGAMGSSLPTPKLVKILNYLRTFLYTERARRFRAS